MSIISSLPHRLFVAAIALSALSGAAFAEEIASCSDQAEAVAAQSPWGGITAIGAGETAGPGQYVAIIYGKKYVVPRSRGAGVHVISNMIGDEISLRNRVYYEELNRCLGYTHIDVDMAYDGPSMIVAGSNGRRGHTLMIETHR